MSQEKHQNANAKGEDGHDFQEEETDRKQLIDKVQQLQSTLNDLWTRVDSVKEENTKLKSENEVLGQYIENLMETSSIFQSIQPKTKSRQKKWIERQDVKSSASHFWLCYFGSVLVKMNFVVTVVVIGVINFLSFYSFDMPSTTSYVIFNLARSLQFFKVCNILLKGWKAYLVKQYKTKGFSLNYYNIIKFCTFQDWKWFNFLPGFCWCTFLNSIYSCNPNVVLQPDLNILLPLKCHYLCEEAADAASLDKNCFKNWSSKIILRF